MAMRMPRFLTPSDHLTDQHIARPSLLREVGEPAEIIPFPGSLGQTPQPAHGAVPARAQLRSRRLTDNARPNEDRYETTFVATGGSPIELLRALTALLESDVDMHTPAGAREALVLDIRLIAG